MRLYLTALNPTGSVLDGFLPAAAALGWDVTILTDRPERYPEHEAIATDVRDPRAMIDTIIGHHPPDVIFSDSDHIQAETALVAEYFGLPGKDWRACATAKNKSLMRRRLAAVEPVRSVRLPPGTAPPADLPYPVVVKPALGVASEDVFLVRDEAELADAIADIRTRRPDDVLVAEEYLEGPLYTLETLGDGHATWILGGFRTTLGPLPRFIEERLDWSPERPRGHLRHLATALATVGVGFGACHTEYVATERGPRIIEINYRLIGDDCGFLLADLLGVPVFEWILRVHAGEPLSTLLPQATTGPGRSFATPPALRRDGVHGTALSLVAGESGVITSAPPAVAGERRGDVRLWHRPLRAAGDRITVTGTNRDYLGIVRAIGPDRASVDTALASFCADHPWVIA